MTQMRHVGVAEPSPGAGNITDVINDVISWQPILPNGWALLGSVAPGKALYFHLSHLDD